MRAQSSSPTTALGSQPDRLSVMHPVNRPRILILLKHYEPAFRFGGPIRSVINLVGALHKEFDFKVVCLNRDFRETQPLDGIEEDVWLNRNGAQVCYVDASLSKPLKLVKAIRSTDYDLVYLNSFFEPLFSTLPALLMKIGILKSQPIIMAPRGEFSLDALALKSFKKALFVRFQWLVKLYGGACWQATTELEAENIRRALGNDIRLWTAPNLSAKVPPTLEKRIAKPTGHLNIVFLSRVSPMKNLLALIRSTGRLRGRVSLDIWGPIDDAEYWRQCQAAMALLPGNVAAKYCGEAHPELVPRVFGEADVFALPTLGENYGHVVHEALASGCPVVISDKTPWRNLAAAGVGFDVALGNPDSFVQDLQAFVDMDAAEYEQYAARCRAYAIRTSTIDADIAAYRQMFLQMLMSVAEQGSSKSLVLNDES